MNVRAHCAVELSAEDSAIIVAALTTAAHMNTSDEHDDSCLLLLDSLAFLRTIASTNPAAPLRLAARVNDAFVH